MSLSLALSSTQHTHKLKLYQLFPPHSLDHRSFTVGAHSSENDLMLNKNLLFLKCKCDVWMRDCMNRSHIRQLKKKRQTSQAVSPASWALGGKPTWRKRRFRETGCERHLFRYSAGVWTLSVSSSYFKVRTTCCLTQALVSDLHIISTRFTSESVLLHLPRCFWKMSSWGIVDRQSAAGGWVAL